MDMKIEANQGKKYIKLVSYTDYGKGYQNGGSAWGFVSLTDGTGISVSGTYPNFTITNTAPSSGGTVTGTGTTNTLPKFTSASSIGDSNVKDNGNVVTVNATAGSFGALQVGNYNGSILMNTTSTSGGLIFQNTGTATTTTLQIDTAFGTIPASTQLNNLPVYENLMVPKSKGLWFIVNKLSFTI